MADRSLMSEVRVNMPIRLAVKAAADQWSGDKTMYTQVPTEVLSHRNGGAHGRRRRTSTQRSENAPPGGATAIEEAKRVVDDALKKAKHGGKNHRGSHGSRNRRSTTGGEDLQAKVDWLVAENQKRRDEVSSLWELVQKLSGTKVSDQTEPAKTEAEQETKAEPEKAGDDFDLFGSESEDDEEKERVKEERLKAYAAKKSKKPGPIAKSSIILDVKPWDDETDLKEMEKAVKSIEKDGLVWGASKLIPIGYGIEKLQVVMTIEDEKVSVDDLIDKITEEFADFVQSADIVAFNKI